MSCSNNTINVNANNTTISIIARTEYVGKSEKLL